jgi:hypothetical protein
VNLVGCSDDIADAGWVLDKIVHPGTTLRQGDLITFTKETNPIRKVGIVITADCDLKNKKHAQILTLSPVISPKVALEYYLVPEDCEKKRGIIENYVFDHFSLDKNQDVNVNIAMLRELFSVNAPKFDSPEHIAANFLLNDSGYMSIEYYKTLMIAIKCAPKSVASFKDQIHKRGDLLILPNTKGLGIDGCIAWVRHIWQTTVSEV